MARAGVPRRAAVPSRHWCVAPPSAFQAGTAMPRTVRRCIACDSHLYSKTQRVEKSLYTDS